MIDKRAIVHRVISKWRLVTDPLVIRFADLNYKTAATVDDILSGLSNEVASRSNEVKVRLKKHPIPMDWDFEATSGGDKYEVSVRALSDESQTPFVSDADILIACSCPFWRWQGPEHHAQKGNYLFGKPRGTAANPKEKDPRGTQYVCKHAAKVLETIRSYVISD